MTEQKLEPSELRLEDFSAEHIEPVSDLLLKFLMHEREKPNDSRELDLVFKSSSNFRGINRLVKAIFTERPELEDIRREIDQGWWDNFTEADKKKYEGNKKFLDQRKEISEYRVALDSPFSDQIHRGDIEHHMENTDTQHRSVVMGRNRALGYLAVWSGASTLYLDGDHMQIDAKVVDPELAVEDQRLVVSKFEPTLYDLSLP